MSRHVSFSALIVCYFNVRNRFILSVQVILTLVYQHSMSCNIIHCYSFHSTAFPVGAIVGIVVGVVVVACVPSILVPVLICCCLGVGVCAALGCAAKKKKDETELKGLGSNL